MNLKKFSTRSFLHGPSIIFIISTIIFYASINHAAESRINIGVLAKRGPERCLEQWSPTAEYLTAAIPGHTFVVLPLPFEKIFSAVERGDVDFILANSSLYVELESRFGVNRIVTLKNKVFNTAYTVFGGVIFCKKERTDIRRLLDLKGKTFMAVDQTSFGGWQMAWRELMAAGINPQKDFSSLFFGGTHDAVVFNVLNGKVDAGTVRTDTMERMHAEKKIDINDFFVVHEHEDEGSHLPFRHSTRLYPEWPLAKVRHTTDEMAEKVAAALMSMKPDSEAAHAAEIIGWTIPSNYQPVHECLKDLKIGPYTDLGKITLYDVIKKYWHVLSMISVLIIMLAGSTAVFIRLNRTIRESNKKLSFEISERERLFEQVKEKNESLQKAMSEIKTLRGILPICSHCKKIRDDKGYWSRIESYIHMHSGAEFSHGICPECAKKYYPDMDLYGDEQSQG